MKFVVYSDRQKWGGTIVLHRIAELISNEGYDVRIFFSDKGRPVGKNRLPLKLAMVISFLDWMLFSLKDILKIFIVKMRFFCKFVEKHNNMFAGYTYMPITNYKRKWSPLVSKDTIVIYPDLVWGNPLNADKVVRYYMYYNRYPNDQEATSKSDLIYAYRAHFNDYNLNPTCRTMTVSFFDFNLYKKNNYGNRKGKCYIIRKGSERKDLPACFDGPIIDELSEQDKVNVLNECEYCISYDTQTAYSTIAAICGCISIVMPEYGKDWKDYRDNDEERYGIAFGVEEEQLEWAKNTVDKAKERYEKNNMQGRESIIKFLSECKVYFKETGA